MVPKQTYERLKILPGDWLLSARSGRSGLSSNLLVIRRNEVILMGDKFWKEANQKRVFKAFLLGPLAAPIVYTAPIFFQHGQHLELFIFLFSVILLLSVYCVFLF